MIECIERIQQDSIYWVIGCSLYFLLLLYLFVYSLRMTLWGIRRKANIISMSTISEFEYTTDTESQSMETSSYALIEYENQNKELIKTKLKIPWHVIKQNKDSLSIVFLKKRPKSPLMDSWIQIFKGPLILLFILLLCFLIAVICCSIAN